MCYHQELWVASRKVRGANEQVQKVGEAAIIKPGSKKPWPPLQGISDKRKMNSENSLSPFQERLKSRKTAVLIPCLNEEQTIAKVIGDFRKELPEAAVYVCDNNSPLTGCGVGSDGSRVVRKG